MSVVPMQQPHPRRAIYYWKCDRPAAFHGTDDRPRDCVRTMAELSSELHRAFPGRQIHLRVAPSQGNHLTYIASIDGIERFVRLEDGPENDDYLEVESHILDLVREQGVPTPRVIGYNASRERVAFAWQALETIAHPDLNQHAIAGTLDTLPIARVIGRAVAKWQHIVPECFGPFNPELLRERGLLQGFHPRYADYFHAHLDRHLHFLTSRQFISEAAAAEFSAAIDEHASLLKLDQGCLVHKDLALWNILGSPTGIAAFIDFDDAIGGDPMDDLSLLGCFHDGAFLAAALEGYESERPLPTEHRRRFWLHLLRNMIVKSVIRVGAGYFNRTGGFFLTGAGNGQQLRAFTLNRLSEALRGLRNNDEITGL